MPSIYKSVKEKVKEDLEKIIIPAIKKKDLDYYRVVGAIASRESCSKIIVEDLLKTFIDSGYIKEIRILTITDDKIQDFLDELKLIEKEVQEELINATGK
jgi:hypothetical protein